MGNLYSPAIECWEVDGSRSESFESGTSGTASVVLRCRWADRLALIDDIVSLRRSHPDYIGLRAKSAQPKSEGVGAYVGDGQVCRYQYALVLFNYETLGPDEEEDGEEVLSERLEPMAEFQLVNHSFFQWGTEAGGNKRALKKEEAVGFLTRSAVLCRDWKRVLGPLTPSLVDKIGWVNSSPYYSIALNQTFATETLLYVPPLLSRSIRSDGVGAWDINMKFMYRKSTWNKYWRGDTAEYDFVRFAADESIYRAYFPGDISDLLVL